MPPVRIIQNQYLGINAHFHSLWQTDGGWNSFHLFYITLLTRLLLPSLRPLGYYADIAASLQRRRGAERKHRYKAIRIFSDRRFEVDLAWIELLTPENKPPTDNFEIYRYRRFEKMNSGAVFVELDYLHQTPATLNSLPDYAARPPGQPFKPHSHPYNIIVFQSRHDWITGHTLTYGFSVDEAIPTVEIPIGKDDSVSADFDTLYQGLFAENFYGNRIDYRQLPVNFSLYSDADKARIVSRMLAVLTAHQAGENLEGAPVPVKTVDLDEGLTRLKVFQDEG